MRRRLWHRAVSVGLAAMMSEAALVTAGAVTSGASASGGVNPASSPAGSSEFRIGIWPWSGSISYNPYSPDFVQDGSLALFALGAYFDHSRPGANPYYPELAQSWTIGAHSITFHLQPNATWQDGTPFTSKDVLTSMLVAGGDFNSVWAAITSVAAPDAHTVVVNLQPWAVTKNVLQELFEFYTVPDSQYGSLVPAGFEKDILTYWKIYDTLHPTTASLAAASNSAAGKAMTKVDTALIKYNPPTLLGNGAYKLVSATVSGVLYEKWTGWWDAKAITAPWIEVYPMQLAEQFGSLETGRIDFQYDTQFTDPEVSELDSSHYGHYIFIPSAVQVESLAPHLADYPLNMLQVRQALEYVINREQLVQLDMGGKLVQDPPQQYPDGINDFEANQYMTKAQFATLNPYNYDPAKAASLLESVGFKKKGGTWYTPKGGAFSLTISEPSANSQFDTDGVVIAKQLSNFGIKAQSVIVNQATYTDQQYAGDYELSENFFDWEVGPPMADFAQVFGWPSLPSYNYPVSYSGTGPFTGQVTIGYGPVSNVPGLGTVNVSHALNAEINEAPPSTWGKYTYDWARWVNNDLPLLPLYNNAFHEAYATSRYTDFPPASAKWLWTNLGDVSQPVVWMQDGYLKLK